MNKQATMNISGFVQGVFYRASAQRAARSLHLNGFVRNLPDGSVEVVAQGEEEFLNRFIEWCRQGPPGAKVDHVAVSWADIKDSFNGFNIR